jgi:vacuolar-type H+-ATPase subunit I/STV1
MNALLQISTFIAAIGLLSGAWIGLQLAFPMFPPLGKVARQLPDSVQMFGVFSLLALSLFIGVCQPIYCFLGKLSSRRRCMSSSTYRSP